MEVDRCSDLRDWLALAAAGQLDVPERLRIEEHLRDGCARCATELDDLRHAVQCVALAWPDEPLDGPALDALVASAAARPQERRERPIVFVAENSLTLGWVVAGLMLLALLGAAWWGRARQAEIATLAQDLELARSRAEQVATGADRASAERAALRLAVDLLVDPRGTAVVLEGGSVGRAFFAADGASVLLSVAGLPPGPGPLRARWVGGGTETELSALEEGWRAGGVRRLELPPSLPRPGRIEVLDGATVLVATPER